MGNRYGHLSVQEREEIAIMRAMGLSKRDIARVLGRNHSTIIRELDRNSPPVNESCYRPSRAHERCIRRRKAAYSRQKLKTPAVREYVEKHLSIGWSPEQISGRISMDMPGSRISHEAIYQYIYNYAPELIGCLARKHRKRRKKIYGRKPQRSNIPNRVSIEERSELVNKRIRFGHWESDSMMAAKIDKTCLNVIAERKSRFVQITKMNDGTSRSTRKAIKDKLLALPRCALRSITYDNGHENVEHEIINRDLKIKSYFCNPYRSWEKGMIENTIGLIRRFIPKGTEIYPLQNRFIEKIEFLLNNRPRKCLAYRTPAEIFIKSGGALPP